MANQFEGKAVGEKSNEVDAYIASAGPAVQRKLRELRRIIRTTAPSATEKVSYGMPFYEYCGQRLVYFAGHKNHIGVYGLVHVESQVPDQLKEFLDHRSTLRFPVERSMPVASIRQAIRERMKQNESREPGNQRGGRGRPGR